MKSLQVLAVACALAGVSSAFAGTITFESAPSTFWETGTMLYGNTGGGHDLGGFYSGVTFGADEQLTSTSTVFPAHSGNLELTDANIANGIIRMAFSTPQPDVSFWYTDSEGFVANAFDKNGVLLKTVAGAGNVNLTTLIGTDSFLDFGVSGIASVTITDNFGLGQGITIDDLSAVGLTGNPVPDATSTLSLFGLAGAGLLALRRKFAV